MDSRQNKQNSRSRSRSREKQQSKTNTYQVNQDNQKYNDQQNQDQDYQITQNQQEQQQDYQKNEGYDFEQQNTQNFNQQQDQTEGGENTNNNENQENDQQIKKQDSYKQQDSQKDAGQSSNNKGFQDMPNFLQSLALNGQSSSTQQNQQQENSSSAQQQQQSSSLPQTNDQISIQQDVTYVHPNQQFNFRHARRLYVGNIPDMITKEYITEWLYRSMEACGGLLEQGNPILGVQIDSQLKFAFIELRSIEETTALLQLDGIILWNRALRVRRPTEYDKYPKVFGTRQIPILDLSLLEGIGILIIPTQVEDSPNKIFLANLPNTLDEYTILENLKLREHGELKAFHLVKDNQTNESKGFAFFEYKDPSITDNVIAALNGCLFYQRTLTCKRAIQDNNGQNNRNGGNKQYNNRGGNNRNNNKYGGYKGNNRYDRNKNYQNNNNGNNNNNNSGGGGGNYQQNYQQNNNNNNYNNNGKNQQKEYNMQQQQQHQQNYDSQQNNNEQNVN